MKGILVRYLPSLYPGDIQSLKRILDYVNRMKEMDVLSEQFKQVLIASGMRLFNEYKEKYASAKNHVHLNWEYIKAMAHMYYTTYGVAMRGECEF